MKCIFLRHGKAVDRGRMPDEQRPLTAAGIKELIASLPYLARVTNPSHPEIWSSPLLRARQTAEILCEFSTTKVIQEKEFIASGNFHELLSELQHTASECVILAGHEPHLSDWIERLTGSQIDVKKGAAICVSFPDHAVENATVAWALRPKEFDQLLEIEAEALHSKTFLEEVNWKLDQYMLQIVNNREIFLSDPAEIEGVHQLRVAIRNFRAIISLIRAYLDKDDYRKIQAVFRRSANLLGLLREVDVLTLVWQQALADNGLDGTKPELLNLLNQVRKDEQQMVAALVKQDRFLKNLQRAFDQLKKSLKTKKMKKVSAPDGVLPSLDQWYEDIRGGLMETQEYDLASIHQIRLICKKYRYISEVFDDLLDQPRQDRYKTIKMMQTVLGDICDAIRNQEAVLELAVEPAGALKDEVELFIEFEKKREIDFQQKLENREWLKFFDEPSEADL